MLPYLVMRIGCLECGFKSEPVGLYSTLTDAEEAHPHARLVDYIGQYDWHGGEMLVIYHLPEYSS